MKGLPNSEGKGSQRGKVKIPLEEPKSKHQKKDIEPALETESEEESRLLLDEQTKEFFQDSDTVVTSKETPIGGGLNSAVRRSKPNQGGPALAGPKSQEQVAMKSRGKKLGQEKKKAAAGVEKQLLPTKSPDPVDPQEPSSSSWSP